MPDLTSEKALHYALELREAVGRGTPGLIGDICRMRPEAGEPLREAVDLLGQLAEVLGRAVSRMHAADCAAAGRPWMVH